MKPRSSSTGDKTLEINLDGRHHGTFAEIGAGQEVARWFFRVGGAAGTVAKTISAYDQKFSDANYGPTQRYVSRERLLAMLDHEYDLVVERLDESRGAATCFFAYANTVAARSHSHPDHAHGWMGVRFQDRPRAAPSQIVMHVNLGDRENIRQQQALGVVGVNLVYGAIYQNENPEHLLGSLLDELAPERVEVDLLELSGPAFEGVDNRIVSLMLVQQGLTDAALFRSDGEVIDPADALYKRAVLVERGAFRPVNRLHTAILERASEKFAAELAPNGGHLLTLFELSQRDIGRPDDPDHRDFLARVDTLAALGGTILVSRFSEHYALMEYLGRYTNEPIRLALGVPALRQLCERRYYEDLRGGILEAFGRLFARNVRLYVYPTREQPKGPLVTSDDVLLAPELQSLLTYLRKGRLVEALEAESDDWLDIDDEDIAERIVAADGSWEALVPGPVAALIKERGFFGYPKARAS